MTAMCISGLRTEWGFQLKLTGHALGGRVTRKVVVNCRALSAPAAKFEQKLLRRANDRNRAAQISEVVGFGQARATRPGLCCPCGLRRSSSHGLTVSTSPQINKTALRSD